MKKTCKKFAVHKDGTMIFGSLCSYREEAEDLLRDLQDNIINMSNDEKSKFKVIEVELSWNENNTLQDVD